VEEILQNVLFIVASVAGGNILARDIGLRDVKDRPQNVVRSFIVAQVHDQVRMHEPRAMIQRTSSTENHETGQMIITVEVEIDAQGIS